MTDSLPFSKLVPGFEFLQDLAKGAGSALPGVGQWVAPTLDPDELGKRIDELRTVQFWLEQNAKMLATTVQALEVQRMTLATLKGMNVSMAEMAESLKVQPEAPTAAPAGDGVDPMQWWGSLTRQFTELASQAIRDGAAAAAQAAEPAAGARASSPSKSPRKSGASGAARKTEKKTPKNAARNTTSGQAGGTGGAGAAPRAAPRARR
jgi:hypothetical protein